MGRFLDLFINKYNYTDFHELNLDWIISDLRTLAETLENFISLNTIKYANPIQWNITTQYEANTVVVDANDGTAYLSIQPVPSGVALTNTDYWTPIFTLNLLSANQNITLRDDGSNVLATFASNTDDWLIWNSILYKVSQPIAVNEAYVVGYNLTRYSVEAFLQDAVNSINITIGDLDDLNTDDKTSVVNAINSVNDNVGDLDNLNTDDKTSIVNAINSVKTESQAKLTIYNVADYGATGDGTTDDTAAIQSTFDAATDGGIVYFPPGQYYVTDTITTSNKTSVLGSGPEASKIFTDQNITIFDIKANYISIKSIMVDGASVANCGLKLEGAFLLVEDCVIAHFANCVYLYQCTAVSFIKCYIVSGTSYGVFIENPGSPDTGDNNFMGCTFDSRLTTGNGILFHSGGGLRLVNNKFLHYGAQISLAPASGVSTSVFICVGNSFEAAGLSALQIGGASGTFSKIVITSNQFADDNYTIRVLSNISYVKIADNFIEGQSTMVGIEMSDCSDIEINDNKIEGVGVGIRGLTNIRKLRIRNNNIKAATALSLNETYDYERTIKDCVTIPMSFTGSANVARYYNATGATSRIKILVSGVIHGVGYVAKNYEFISSYNGATYTNATVNNTYAVNDIPITVSNGVISMTENGTGFDGTVTIEYENINTLTIY